MVNNKVHMTCKKETKDLIMGECKDYYMKFHPEEKGRTITQAEMLHRLAEFWLTR